MFMIESEVRFLHWVDLSLAKGGLIQQGAKHLQLPLMSTRVEGAEHLVLLGLHFWDKVRMISHHQGLDVVTIDFTLLKPCRSGHFWLQQRDCQSKVMVRYWACARTFQIADKCAVVREQFFCLYQDCQVSPTSLYNMYSTNIDPCIFKALHGVLLSKWLWH